MITPVVDDTKSVNCVIGVDVVCALFVVFIDSVVVIPSVVVVTELDRVVLLPRVGLSNLLVVLSVVEVPSVMTCFVVTPVVPDIVVVTSDETKAPVVVSVVVVEDSDTVNVEPDCFSVAG